MRQHLEVDTSAIHHSQATFAEIFQTIAKSCHRSRGRTGRNQRIGVMLLERNDIGGGSP